MSHYRQWGRSTQTLQNNIGIPELRKKTVTMTFRLDENEAQVGKVLGSYPVLSIYLIEQIQVVSPLI